MFTTGFFTALGVLAAIAAVGFTFGIFVGLPCYIWYRRKRDVIKKWAEILRGMSNVTPPVDFSDLQ